MYINFGPERLSQLSIRSDAAPTLCPSLGRICQNTLLKNFYLQNIIPERASYVEKFIFSPQVLSAYHHHQTVASTPSHSDLCKSKSGPLEVSHRSQGKDQTTKLLNVRGQDRLTLPHSTLQVPGTPSLSPLEPQWPFSVPSTSMFLPRAFASASPTAWKVLPSSYH